jgi:hypothetical protein
MARDVLSKQNTHNRKMKHKKVKKIAAAIRRGKYLATHQAIAFAEDGTLLDGQNRLAAILQAEKSVLLLTCFGLPNSAQSVIDGITPRTHQEQIALGFDHDVNRMWVATAKAMVGMGVTVDMDSDELEDFLLTHWNAIAAAMDLTHGSPSSPIIALLARATYSVPGEALKRFYSVFSGGPFDAEEEAAARFGEAVRNKTRLTRGDLYAAAQRALLYFLNGKPVKQSKPLYGNYFPLPGQKADQLPRELSQLKIA